MTGGALIEAFGRVRKTQRPMHRDLIVVSPESLSSGESVLPLWLSGLHRAAVYGANREPDGGRWIAERSTTRRSARNSEPGSTPVISRRSRARVQAT